MRGGGREGGRKGGREGDKSDRETEESGCLGRGERERRADELR